jgi:hypothetical protein
MKNVDGNDISDLHRNCETARDAYPDTSVNRSRCDDDDEPAHEW